MRSSAGQRARPLGVALLAAAALALAPSASTADGEVILTAAGNGGSDVIGDGGQATEIALDRPRSVAATRDGGYVWTEPRTHRVRRVGSDGIVTTIAGTGRADFLGDGGPAAAAALNFVHDASEMLDGGYVLADMLNNRIRRIWPDGKITTVAGTGEEDYHGDGGPATAAAINAPRCVASLPDGGFLIADTGNHRVRRVWPDGTITTVAGRGGQGFSGDGGPAVAALLSAPFGVAPTADGGFLIVEVGNQRIRKVTPDGTIVTVAGNGTAGYSGDGGPATAARINQPHDIATLPDGGFLIADTANHRIRRVGIDGRITTIAGMGAPGYAGDGKRATGARLRFPKGVAVRGNGAILVADEQNNRIRYIGVHRRPARVKSPSVGGELAVGQTIRAHPGAWRGHGVEFAYAWESCGASSRSCKPISGARGATFLVRPVDLGRRFRVEVTASTLTLSASARSPLTARVGGKATFPFPITSSDSDGHVFRFETAEGVTPTEVDTKGKSVVAARSIHPEGVVVSVGLLRFDTSAIPANARITSVTLLFQVVFAASKGRLRLVVEPYPSERWPIDPSDFATRPKRKVVGSVSLTALHNNASAEMSLRPQAVRRGSFTGLRLLVPGGRIKTENGVAIAAIEHPEFAVPSLLVSYTTG